MPRIVAAGPLSARASITIRTLFTVHFLNLLTRRDPIYLSQCSSFGYAIPWEQTDYRDEVLSWKQACCLNAAVNTTPSFPVKGPDAMKFLSGLLSQHCQQISCRHGYKHGIMCTEEGLVMMDGVIIRAVEDNLTTYWLSLYLSSLAMVKGG